MTSLGLIGDPLNDAYELYVYYGERIGQARISNRTYYKVKTLESKHDKKLKKRFDFDVRSLSGGAKALINDRIRLKR